MLRAIIALSFIGLIVTGFVLVNALLEENQRPEPLMVVLLADAPAQTITTRAATVGDLLEERGVRLATADVVLPDSDTALSDGLRIVVQRARMVRIRVDDDARQIDTTHENPFDILRQAQITVGVHDAVRVDGQMVHPADLIAWPLPADDIAITRARPITIIDGDESRTVQTTAATVGDALFEAGVPLYMVDSITPPVNAPVSADMEIVVDRSRAVVIQADGTRTETRVNAQTVGGALAEAGITLQGLDYSIPDENIDLLPNMTIRVIRVTEEIVNYEEVLPFETRYQADDSLPLDTRRVIQAGQEGLYERVERVRYENGVEVRRTVESEGVTRVPQDGIVAYGTQIIVRTLDTPDGPVEYWRHLRMYATSYRPASVGGSTTTSIGETLRKGIIAIDPTIVNYRTNMYVPGYGQGFAADTGGPRRSPYWVDLGYEDHDWVGWSRWVDVYLLLPVPDNVRYILPPSGNEGGPVID
ncbi:MAG: DUF348 domain-containing protein [Anaerolineaceae bacterium]|nr:MAG: DUF348 domain-containing protein [Anaerolineaceae bacterium]